jgi:cell division protein FtsB
MIIPITCPDCSKQFKIDVPAIERYKAENNELRKELYALRQQLNKLKADTDGVDYLKNIFGMD